MKDYYENNHFDQTIAMDDVLKVVNVTESQEGTMHTGIHIVVREGGNLVLITHNGIITERLSSGSVFGCLPIGDNLFFLIAYTAKKKIPIWFYEKYKQFANSHWIDDVEARPSDEVKEMTTFLDDMSITGLRRRQL
jgi:hypothetical protein